MYHSPDCTARGLQDFLREQAEEKRRRYEILKTSESKVEYLLALKQLSEMACWRVGG
jgi:hypothetical protein